MKRKFKLIAPSLAVIIVCLLLMLGSTFAIFTSVASADISVSSGKVHVSATLGDLQAYSAEAVTKTEYDALTGDNAIYKAGQAEAFGVSSYFLFQKHKVDIVNNPFLKERIFYFVTVGVDDVTIFLHSFQSAIYRTCRIFFCL